MIQKRHCMEINSEDSCIKKKEITPKLLTQPAFSAKDIILFKSQTHICRKLEQNKSSKNVDII